jgi:hypothetical protein
MSIGNIGLLEIRFHGVLQIALLVAVLKGSYLIKRKSQIKICY